MKRAPTDIHPEIWKPDCAEKHKGSCLGKLNSIPTVCLSRGPLLVQRSDLAILSLHIMASTISGVVLYKAVAALCGLLAAIL